MTLTSRSEIRDALTAEGPADILIIEDDMLTAENLADTLQDSNRLIRIAGTAADARRMISARTPSLVVLDLILPDTDGRTLLAQLRSQPITADIPILVLTAKNRPSVEAECLALGADAVFEKSSLRAAFAADVTSWLRRSSAALRAAGRDPLTGLPNRAAFRESYDRAIKLAGQNQTLLSVSILGLDHLKSVNDTYGRETGDDVLRSVATLLPQVLNQSVFIARWGSDKFGLLFFGSSALTAAGSLQKALAVVAAEKIESHDGRIFSITFSAGTAEALAHESMESAIESAEALLYNAKESGGARVFHPDDAIPVRKRRILIAEDDDLTAEILSHYINRHGYEIVRASDGEEALRILQEGEVILAIMDVQMPIFDGFEVLSRMRALAVGSKPPVIMLTVLGHEKAIARALEAGADDYVVKPFSPPELMARIRRVLRGA